MNSEEFYVGYLPTPPRLRRTLLRVVLGLGGVFAALALVLVLAQSRFAASVFEFGRYREFSGEIRERPYPHLLVASFARYWLVAPGKHGAAEIVRGLDGKTVRLTGSLISRGRDTMLEVTQKPILLSRDRKGAVPFSTPQPITLTGEIVDSKCYFGVMNPGSGKVHRDCAVRCIGGGIPPAFIAKDADGNPRTLLLVGADGRPLNREVLDFVAEPITITGRLVRSGDTLVLRAEPGSFIR